jgi:hypothetical protein
MIMVAFVVIASLFLSLLLAETGGYADQNVVLCMFLFIINTCSACITNAFF